ncbi:hypothetical protein EJC49_21850 [Aquibium carbonis]|uniref:Uncharacterized protein n=1 Tax=Aquibium carbonis TaxID=2495581 RepID=A0A429YR69_9HYPH|nr:DUF4286 family protein [Aquibium carbonis]RST83904.1 hypothetical protein EJC49_21850 [Aquibium carbonis]
MTGLLGRGVLVNWGGVVAEQEDDYNAWHSMEHMPERLSVPGFRRGRRAIGVDGTSEDQKYFMMYEAETADVFVSPPYLARLNDPTPWTRRILSAYVAPSRTVCRVRQSIGRGVGGWNATVQFADPLGPIDWLPAIADIPGVLGAHILDGDTQLGQQPTAEKAFRESRGEVDRTVVAAILIDSYDHRAAGISLRATLDRLGDAAEGAIATMYRVQHVIGAEDAR